jgi:hypothetical protein
MLLEKNSAEGKVNTMESIYAKEKEKGRRKKAIQISDI